MRAFCTVSAPLEVCAPTAEQLSPGSRFLALRLLGHQQPRTLYFLVDSKSRVREVYTQTCLHFSNQGMLDTDLFGLAVLIDGEYLFADPESKLSKYGPKSWRSSHTHGLDANGRPLLELHFRVQFYIESPLMLKDEITRHNYYLQLKYNSLHRNIPHEYSEESMIVLTGLALQADLGDAPTTTASATIKSDGENKLSFIDVTGGGEGKLDGACTTKTFVKATTTDTTQKTTVAALPPKVHANKHGNLINERVLRLSSYVMKTTNQSGAGGGGGGIKKTDSCTSSANSGVEQDNVQAFSTASVSRGSSSASTIASVSTNASSRTDYFRLEDYLPPHLRTAWAASAVRACHRENRTMSSADAERHYIQHACLVNEFMNAHTFRMRMTKSEIGPGNSWFIVYPKGIKIFGGDLGREGVKHQITFLWPNITKLSFERKKFEIRSGENKITLYATSDEKNKSLLTLCKETHQFSMKMAARLKEVIKREEEEHSCLQSNYIYSRSIHLPLYKNKHDQRISVISSTSSNTTSGIVSDRVHSEDELEIMINSPPAPLPAPSTESLALAHLLDKPSVSRQASSIDQVSLKELKEQLVVLSGRHGQKQRSNTSNSDNESPTELSNSSSTENSASTIDATLPTSSSQCNATSSCTESPTSQHNIGSQCSSTCSTVVVASSTSCGNTNSLTTLSVSTDLSNTTANNHRRNSTSSSLELGFSHTAQNSTLSEPETHYGDQSFIPIRRDENESICGVYTLVDGNPPTETSGVYTMNSSELTGQSSEIAESEKGSCYNIFQSTKTNISKDNIYASESVLEDAVDGRTFHNKSAKNENTFRFRSDSNISTSDSFRGDGSDPTDNKHTLLSAEELTNLIVGRGVYPKRKVSSNINDTDSDYLTLPSSSESDLYLKGHKIPVCVENNPNAILTKSSVSVEKSMPNMRRMRSPPPYNATHNKTGLCGPPITDTVQKFSCQSISNEQLLPVSSKLITEKVPIPLTPSDTNAKMLVKTPKKFVSDSNNPPPYSAGTKPRPRPTSLVSLNSAKSTLPQPLKYSAKNLLTSSTSTKSEEIPAKFITARSHINILKAHTSLVNEYTKPSFATPAKDSLLFSTGGSVGGHNLPSNLMQHSVNNCNYISASQNSLNLGSRQHSSTPTTPTHTSAMPVAAVAHVAGVLPPANVGIPVVSYGLHATHRSMSSLHQQQQNELKQSAHRTCVLLPVIKPRQYLPPPPPSLPRQPPPPPPTQLNSLYSSPLSSKQLDLYQQQLYSDVDYVIYPLQDPVISQQEYLDAKQSSLLAAMAQTPPSHHPYLAAYHHVNAVSNTWDTCKGHAIYRSTPYLPLTFSSHSRYASTQNLSDTCVQLPSAYSPIYSPSLASMCSSFEPPPPIHPAALDSASANPPTGSLFLRSRSDDNILNSLDLLPKGKRLPPPPPPPYIDRRLKKPPIPVPVGDNPPPPIPSKPRYNLNYGPTTVTSADLSSHTTTSATRTKLPPRRPITLAIHNTNSGHMTKTSSGAQWAGERPKPNMGIGCTPSNNSNMKAKHQSIINVTSSSNATGATAKQFDIELLREKSKHLDLPLISALCNDHSLLKQTNILENYKLSSTSSSSNNNSTMTTAEAMHVTSSVASINDTAAMLTTLPPFTATTTVSTVLTATSKLLTTSSNGNSRKTSISHRHPNDKLPPLPMQIAEANNYVMEPASMKHLKSSKPH